MPASARGRRAPTPDMIHSVGGCGHDTRKERLTTTILCRPASANRQRLADLALGLDLSRRHCQLGDRGPRRGPERRRLLRRQAQPRERHQRGGARLGAARSAIGGIAGVTGRYIVLLLVAEIVEKVAWRPVFEAGGRLGGLGASLVVGISRWEPRFLRFLCSLCIFYITHRIRRLRPVAPGLLPGSAVSGSAPWPPVGTRRARRSSREA